MGNPSEPRIPGELSRPQRIYRSKPNRTVVTDFGASIGYLRYRQGWPPHVLTAIVAYSRKSAPSPALLADRIGQLQGRFPDLRLKLIPRDVGKAEEGVQHPLDWSQETGPWATDTVLETFDLDSKQTSTMDAWNNAHTVMESKSPKRNPLFLVSRIESAECTYVGLSVSHCLMDGMGMVNFLKALTIQDVSGLPDESSAGYLISKADRPAKVVPEKAYTPWTPPPQKEPSETPVWPHGSNEFRARLSIDRPPVFVPFELPQSAVKDLKIACTSHQLATINAILLAAFVEALASTLSVSDRRFKIIVPRSVRSSSDPYLFGGHNDNYEFSVSPTGNPQSVWNTASSIVDSMKALQAEMDKPTDKANLTSEPEPSHSPETIVRRTDEAMEQIPFRYSLIWSNLTKWSWLDEIDGAQDIMWGQSMIVLPSPIMVNLCGWKGGVRAVVGIRDGCAVSSEELRDIVRCWSDSLEGALVTAEE